MREPESLLELQRVDVDILRLDKKLDELPEKKAILASRAKQREISALKDKAGMLVRKLEAEVKSRTDEMTMLTDKIDSEQAKLMATADHRAVQAISREMDGLKRRRDKLEMETLQFVERVDKASAQVATVEAHLAKLAEQETALTDRFKQVGGEVQAEITRLKKERDKLVADIKPETLERYEAVRASRGGIGVGKLDGSTCTACRMELPAERVRELSSGPDIATCPQCRRLIVVRVEVA